MKKIRKTYKHDQVNINGHFLYEANKGSKRGEFALFVILQSLYPHKTFNRTHLSEIERACGCKLGNIYRLIQNCEEWGIIEAINDKKGTKRLISNKEIQAKFGGNKQVSCYISKSVLRKGLKAVKILAANMPAISCVKAQPNGYKKNLNRHYKSDASIGRVVNGETIYTIAEHKLLLKANKKGLNKITFDETVSLSNERGKELNKCSKNTFIKHKYYLETMGVWCVARRYEILQEGVSIDEWLFMKKDLEAYGFVSYAKYNPFTLQVYRDLACGFEMRKHA